jgi:hypothetical protein
MDQLKQLKIRHDEVHIRCSELEVERDLLKQTLLQEQSLRAKMQKDIEQVGTKKKAILRSMSDHYMHASTHREFHVVF